MPALAKRQNLTKPNRIEKARKEVETFQDLLKRFPIQLDPSILPPVSPQVWESDENHVLRHSAECEEKDQ